MPNMTDIEHRYSHADAEELEQRPEGEKDLSDWAYDLACHRVQDFQANPPENGELILSSSYITDDNLADWAFAYLNRIPDTVSELSGLRVLSLDGAKVSDVSSLVQLASLQQLRLNDTWVSDLSPLRRLTSLQFLQLGGTLVSDLSPIEQLASLQSLHLGDTSVSDLSPLGQLTSLQFLHLGGTSVSDLSPLIGLTGLEHVFLNDTPAYNNDPELQRILEIEDERSRVRKLIKYLNSGEYKPPLASPPLPDPSKPTADLLRYAPIDPEFRDGKLRAPQRLKGDSAEDYRHDAWGIMRDSLKMLVARLGDMNHPDLRDVVQLLARAVGDDFNTFRDTAFYEALKGFKSGSAPFAERLTPETFARIQQIIDSGEFYIARSESCQKWIAALKGTETARLEEAADKALDAIGVVEANRDLLDEYIPAITRSLEHGLRVAKKRQKIDDRNSTLVAIAASLRNLERETKYACDELKVLTDEARQIETPNEAREPELDEALADEAPKVETPDESADSISKRVRRKWKKYAEIFARAYADESGRQTADAFFGWLRSKYQQFHDGLREVAKYVSEWFGL